VAPRDHRCARQGAEGTECRGRLPGLNGAYGLAFGHPCPRSPSPSVATGSLSGIQHRASAVGLRAQRNVVLQLVDLVGLLGDDVVLL
jgi:hypothetical protein